MLPHINRILSPVKNTTNLLVEMVDVQDGKFVYYEATMPKEIVDLILYIKSLAVELGDVGAKTNKLWRLIEDYGQVKFEDGCENERDTYASNNDESY